MSVDQETEGLANYVVNLRSGTVLGKTAGTHFGVTLTFKLTSGENDGTPALAWSGSDAHPE